MKILFVQQDTCLYGASKSLLTLIEQLTASTHDCFVLLPKHGPLLEKLEAGNIPHAVIPWRGWTCAENGYKVRSFTGGMKDLLVNKKRIRNALNYANQFQPDIIHTNSSKTYFGVMLAHKLKIPHIWHFREFLGGPFSCGLRFRFGRLISEWVISRYSNANIFISYTVSKQFQYINSSKNIIYNGVRGLNEIREKTDFPQSSSPLRLCLVGRFDELKDPLTALKAMNILKNKRLDEKIILNIAGWGGNQLDKSLEYISKHSLESMVQVHGMVQDIERIYACSHVLLMPSRGDAFGRVTAEAMAYGRPVIGAKAGATPELINNGKDGLLFETGDYVELASHVEHLINHPEDIKTMGENARQKAMSLFSYERYFEDVLNVYLEVLSETSTT